jgi:hypothetical protein
MIAAALASLVLLCGTAALEAARPRASGGHHRPAPRPAHKPKPRPAHKPAHKAKHRPAHKPAHKAKHKAHHHAHHHGHHHAHLPVFRPVVVLPAPAPATVILPAPAPTTVVLPGPGPALAAPEAPLQTARYLRVVNRTGQTIKVFVKLGTDDTASMRELAPGAVAELTNRGAPLVASQVFLWAEGDGYRFLDYRNSPLVLVSAPYRAAAIDTCTFTFNP